MNEFIHKLGISISQLEKTLSAQEYSGQFPPSIFPYCNLHFCNKVAFQVYNKKLRILIVYSPNGPNVPTGYVRSFPRLQTEKESSLPSANPELKKKMDLLRNVHSIAFAVEQGTQLKSIIKFIKNRIKTMEDIVWIKGIQYYERLQQQIALQAVLDKTISMEDFPYPEEEEDEEIVHSLSEKQNGIDFEENPPLVFFIYLLDR